MNLESKEWSPSPVKAGDRVKCRYRPEWGIGIVIEAMHSGTLVFASIKKPLAWTFHKKDLGQRVVVKFESGRSRTIITTANPLEIITENYGKHGSTQRGR